MGFFAICSQCGKKLPAFRLTNGICASCDSANRAAKQQQQQAQHQANRAEATEYYNHLVDLWKNTGDRWYDSEYKTLSEAKHVLEDCETFETLLSEIPNYDCFHEVFSERCSYVTEKSCSNADFGTLAVTQVDPVTVKVDFEQLLNKISRRKETAAKIVQNTEKFYSGLNQINLVDIAVDATASSNEKQSTTMFQSKNITARTRLDSLNPFYAVDVETTGLNPNRDEIISLTAVKFVNMEPVDAFSTYIKPRNGLNPSAQRINGITEEDVANAPYIEAISQSFFKFITPDISAKHLPPVIGHNLSFDYNFLYANGINTLCFTRNHYDTLELSRRQYKDWRSYKLDYLSSQILNIARSDAHSSLSDALAAGLLFKKICKERIGF
jgi:DNA polymerase III epsilon subunit-like protein